MIHFKNKSNSNYFILVDLWYKCHNYNNYILIIDNKLCIPII